MKHYSSAVAHYPGHLYRCFAADGSLLYVGATSFLRQRLNTHRRTTPWWGEVVTTTSEPYEHRWQAMAAERRAIVTERPRYNRQRRFVDVGPEAAS